MSEQNEPVEIKNLDQYCIIAVSPTYWGRGKTVNEAKSQLRKSGGSVKDCQLRMIIGCSDAYVDGYGYLRVTNADSKSFVI